jgi:hypothetical protein
MRNAPLEQPGGDRMSYAKAVSDDLERKNGDYPPRVISDEEFNLFLIDRKLRAECIECGSNDWQILGQHSSEVPALLFTNEQKSIIGTNVPLIILACKVCGHARLFARNAILQFLEKKAAGA